jgi:hypothetical protein
MDGREEVLRGDFGFAQAGCVEFNRGASCSRPPPCGRPSERPGHGRQTLIRGVADYLPSKEGTRLPKWLRLIVAKHDDVLGIEGDDKLGAVALKCSPAVSDALCPEANCPRLPFALVRRHSGQGRDHDAGRDQRILADHVGWHSDGVAGDQAHQQRSRHGSGRAENQVDCLILAHCRLVRRIKRT